MTLLVGRQEGHPDCKKTKWWGADVVVCLQQGADSHMAHLMPLPLTVSCFSKIQIGFIFLVPAHPGSPRKKAVKRARVCINASEFVSGSVETRTLTRMPGAFSARAERLVDRVQARAAARHISSSGKSPVVKQHTLPTMPQRHMWLH